MRYKTFTGSMDRFAFVDYLKSLVRSVDKPIIVITDGHPAHRAKFTKEYVEQEPIRQLKTSRSTTACWYQTIRR